MMKRYLAFLLLFAHAAANDPAPSSGSGPMPNAEAFEQIARFTLALEQVRHFYVQSGQDISYEALIDGAIEGMMGRLDRYSGFMENRQAQSMREMTRGQFGGVGIVVSLENRQLTVVSPVEGTPGWEAGLLTGDQIVEIDGVPTRGLNMEQSVDLLRGEVGTPVTLSIRRQGERRPFDVTLVRAVIETQTVQRHRMLEDEIAYIRLTSFTETTPRMLREELTRVQRQQARGLILDLRGNPGGSLNAAIEVASLFLPQQTLVVFTEGNDSESRGRQDFFSVGRRHEVDLPLVLLVNQGSASASEVVAGALQDHGRARLVGQRTFGKGSVQSVLPLRDGSALRLTTAIYFSPSGNQIHERGIEPNVAVNFPMRRWRESLRLIDTEAWDWREDPQLAEALALLRNNGDGAGDSGSSD